MECDKCGWVWMALMECAKTERLECPHCGYMVQAPPQNEGTNSEIPNY